MIGTEEERDDVLITSKMKSLKGLTIAAVLIIIVGLIFLVFSYRSGFIFPCIIIMVATMGAPIILLSEIRINKRKKLVVYEDSVLYFSNSTISKKIPFDDIEKISVSHNFFGSTLFINTGTEGVCRIEYLTNADEIRTIILPHIKEDIKDSKEIDYIYKLSGVRGRSMTVYENKVIIETKRNAGSLITNNFNDGEKTIFYKDCIGIQFKEHDGLTIGYLQLETASSMMNNKNNNFFNENSFTFNQSTVSNKIMREVAAYIEQKVSECKSTPNSIKQSSPADEVLKLKQLLDMGAITQEEFDAKKKDILDL